MTQTPLLNNPITASDLSFILGQPLRWADLNGLHVLVTGATGMHGGYLAKTLLSLQNTHCPDLRVTLQCRSVDTLEARLGQLCSSSCAVVESDFTTALPELCKTYPDVIIHTAGPTDPRAYTADPVSVIDTTVNSTLTLLQRYARDKEIRFLYWGTAVYGAIENDGPVNETSFGAIETLDVRNCYIQSKRMVETLLESWRHQYGLHYHIGRIFHTFGPGLPLDDGRIFSDVVNAMLNRAPIALHGDGQTMRTFTYLADTVSALFWLLLKGQAGQAYNIGNPANEMCIADFGRLAAGLMTPPLDVVLSDPPQGYIPAKTRRGLPDIAKITQLGWRPAFDVRSALDRTYRSYLS